MKSDEGSCRDISIPMIIKQLATQQFYLGGNKVYSRTMENYVQIKGSGFVVNKLIKLLQAKCNLLLDNKIEEYVDFIINTFPELDKESILNAINEKLKMITDPNAPESETLKTTFVVSEIITGLRKVADDLLKKKIREAAQKYYPAEKVDEIIGECSSANNKQLGLLENLVYLDLLADRFSFKGIRHVIRIQISRTLTKLMRDMKEKHPPEE